MAGREKKQNKEENKITEGFAMVKEALKDWEDSLYRSPATRGFIKRLMEGVEKIEEGLKEKKIL